MEFSKELIRINEILELKVELFKKYEEITDLLIDFDIDTSKSLFKEREKTLNKIKKLNLEFKDICDNLSIGEEIRDATYNRVNWNDCSDEYSSIFKLGQDIIGCISRVRRKEPSIVENVEKQKEKILEDIKKQKNSVEAKSSKYYRATQPMGAQNFKVLDSKL